MTTAFVAMPPATGRIDLASCSASTRRPAVVARVRSPGRGVGGEQGRICLPPSSARGMIASRSADFFPIARTVLGSLGV